MIAAPTSLVHLLATETEASAASLKPPAILFVTTDDTLMTDEQVTGVLLEHAGDIYMLNGLSDVALRYWRLAVQKADESCTPLLHKKLKKKKYVK